MGYGDWGKLQDLFAHIPLYVPLSLQITFALPHPTPPIVFFPFEVPDPHLPPLSSGWHINLNMLTAWGTHILMEPPNVQT